MKQKNWQIAVLDALLTLIYVSGVATFMNYGEKIFGKQDSVLSGIAILMLFVLSAVIVGSLVLGKPLMLYLDNQKKEAVKILGLTILFLFVLTLIAMLLLIII